EASAVHVDEKVLRMGGGRQLSHLTQRVDRAGLSALREAERTAGRISSPQRPRFDRVDEGGDRDSPVHGSERDAPGVASRPELRAAALARVEMRDIPAVDGAVRRAEDGGAEAVRHRAGAYRVDFDLRLEELGHPTLEALGVLIGAVRGRV